MKAKIKTIWTRLNSFRREKLFCTAKEVRGLMLTYRNHCEGQLGIRRDKFKNACLEFAAIRGLTRKKFVWRLEYDIDPTMLESKAGPEQAAGAVAVEIAKQILERHRKHIANIEAERNKHIAGCPALEGKPVCTCMICSR